MPNLITSPPITVITEPHPYGEFWVVSKSGRYNISRVDIVKVSEHLGFRLMRGELYRAIGITLHLCDERQFQDAVSGYIQDIGQIAYKEIQNCLETFLQNSTKFTISRLPIIDRNTILRDNATTCYKFYKNLYIKITSDELTQFTYDQFPKDKLILFSSIAQRDYQHGAGGKYIEYLSLATPWTEQHERICQIIGYLSHEYKDETTGYIIVLIEQCADPKDGGGSGKNIFCNLLSHTTTYHSKNGSQAKFDEKFFQSWNGQRIMGISDVPKNFQYQFLKEPSTGTFILKKLFKDEIEIPVEDGPKFVIQTQFSYEVSDGGLRRRIIPIEFTDFFTRSGGVDIHFGCHFPLGWSEGDWNGFDTLIINSVQKWLQSGRKLTSVELTETGWQKQFKFTYHTIYTAIKELMPKWEETVTVFTEDLKNDLQAYYNENKIHPKYQPNIDKVNDALRDWCRHYLIPFKTNAPARDQLNNIKKAYIFGGV